MAGLVQLQRQAPATEHYHQGIWRDGDLAIMVYGAVLPNRCVKSNEPADQRVNISVSQSRSDAPWVPGMRGLNGVLDVATQDQTTIRAHLCPRHYARRREWLTLRWCCGLCVVASVVMAVAAAVANRAGLLLIVGILLAIALAGIIASIRGLSILNAERFTSKHVYVSGFSEEFLMSLTSFEAAQAAEAESAAAKLAQME